MTTILNFSDQDHEDNLKLKRMLAADDLCYFIWEWESYLRRLYKNEDTTTVDSLWENWHEMKSNAVLDAMDAYQ
jgi:hypothetical protein